MSRMHRTSLLAIVVASLIVAVPTAQAGRAARGRSRRRGSCPDVATRKPAIPNVKAVRSCESLAKLALPHTTIESAATDPDNQALCRVTARTTHPPMGDRVRIWFAIPTSNWNGRALNRRPAGIPRSHPSRAVTLT